VGGFELLAVIVFFLIGYWVVDFLWPKKKAAAPAVVRVTRRFDASPERVFDAWLDPAQAGKFLFATATGQMVCAEIDPRVGGKFTFTDRRDGQDVAHTGEYLEINRPRCLVFSFSVDSSPSTRVTIEIASTESGCELTLTHELDPKWAEHAARTEAGWIGILDGLATALGQG